MQNQNNQKRRGFTQQKNNIDKEEGIIKKYLCSLLTCYLEQIPSFNEGFFNMCQILEMLSLLWFVFHPSLRIMNEFAIFNDYFFQVLKKINFYQHMADGVSYIPMVWSALIYTTIVIVIVIFPLFNVSSVKNKDLYKLIRKIGNLLFYSLGKVLSGPIIGLAINILYCDSGNVDQAGNVCYSPQHIFYCGLAFILLIQVLYSMAAVSILYYSRDPFEGNCLGHPNRNYMVSKCIIKIMLPLFFAVNGSLKIDFIYIVASPAIWGVYIIFHRFNSYHSFNHKHFYLQFLLESFLFGTALFVLISYFLVAVPNPHLTCLPYMTCGSILEAYLIVSLEKRLHQNFLRDSLENKIKKQNIERFILAMINKLIHTSFEESKISLHIYTHLVFENQLKEASYLSSEDTNSATNRLNSDQQQTIQNQINRESEEDKDEEQTKKEIFEFLLFLINKYQKDCKIVFLKIIKCQLLRFIGHPLYSLHQLLEIKYQKITYSEQLSLLELRYKWNLEQNHQIILTECKAELQIIYNYQDECNRMEELMNECAANNAQYWEELGETVPSLPKLRSLASKYVDYAAAIANSYAKLTQTLPESCTTTANYLHFLLQVGVDVREAVKVREELRTKLEREGEQRSAIGGLSTSEVAMVAVDSVGSRLGQIVNCNTETQRLLGHQKESLLSKNITRIMPKVYAELHNDFILNFLRGKTSAANSDSDSADNSSRSSGAFAEKIVTPLTSEGVLVEVGLRLHPVSDSQASLLVVGFMDRREDSGEAIAMVDSHSGVLLAIDARFVAMLKNKVNGKQVATEEVRLSSLFPELDLAKLEKEGTQDSFLEVEHLCEQDVVNIQNPQVTVEIRQTKHYINKKIIFLSIYSKNQKPSSIKHMISFNKRSSSNSIQIPNMQNILQVDKIKDCPKKQNCQSRILSSINCTEVTTCVESNGRSQLIDDLPFSRKFEQYIEMKENKQFKTKLKVCYIFIFLCLSTYLVMAFVFRNKYLQKAETMYGTMKIFADIPYHQAQISLYNNRIWCVLSYHYFETRFASFQPLSVAVDELATQYMKVVQSTINEDYPLQYNQNIMRNYSIFKNMNGTSSYQNITLDYKSAIENYINCGKIMQDEALVAKIKATNKYLVQQQAYYITANGNFLIPSIAIEAVNSYYQYFLKISQYQKKTVILIKSGLIILSLLCFLIVILIANKLYSVQQQVFNFHSKLRLWDINELSYKCNQYLDKKGKNNRKQRKSSLLKIFPVQTFVDLAQSRNIPINKYRKASGKHTVLKSEEEEQNMLCISSINSEIYVNQGESKTTNIKIQWQEDSRNILLFILIIIIGTMLLLGLSMYFQYGVAASLTKKFQFVKDVGIIRKTLTYLNLFVNRMVASHPDPSYYTNIGIEAKQFYKYSGKTYQQLGNSVFSSVYSVVETVQSHFGAPGAYTAKYPMTYLRDMYNSQISTALQGACDKIILIQTQIYEPQFFMELQTDRFRQIIFTIVLWFIGLLLILLFHFFYFAPIYYQRSQTINMLRIMPVWLIKRNPQVQPLINS